ncbi:DUF3224 domain-containing protein [Microbulbifer spongiae]|uniref:DUF3224 domain-containing protein n=1 Tax=Microbulbifer spongiae TaxID=2944933 RepID=A0ABY9EDX9_9GAMM|nr:DUF3224 domain-containing protein [Microbulbifer sp. MI-G]WKD50462.1 DUF3224 domain-containing protein [Microbulbifer sp. MI-G]
MRRLRTIIPLLLLMQCGFSVSASDFKGKEQIMSASGAFEIQLDPQGDDNIPAGRMIFSKKYTGGLVGSGAGQMLSKRTDGGIAVYMAIEEFKGSLDGQSGSFTLVHKGYMSGETQRLEINILQGSGKGELKKISGSMQIIQEKDQHNYVLTYKL